MIKSYYAKIGGKSCGSHTVTIPRQIREKRKLNGAIRVIYDGEKIVIPSDDLEPIRCIYASESLIEPPGRFTIPKDICLSLIHI